MLAGIATVVSFVVATAVFRLWRIENRVVALLWVFAVSCAVLIAVYLLTPSDLLVFMDTLLAGPQWFDLGSAVFFFFAAFFGGVLQIYNLADRGFSLRILIDLYEHSDEWVERDALLKSYSAGRGISWMYQKRIDDMQRNDLIAVDVRDAVVTARGIRTARIFGALRRLYCAAMS